MHAITLNESGGELACIRVAHYQLLEALLPWVGLLVLLRVDLEELPCLGVHHGPRVLKHLHVQPLPATQHRLAVTTLWVNVDGTTLNL